jgi:hypothetical protein
MPPSFRRCSRRASVALVAAALLLASCHGSNKKATTTSGTPSTDAHGKPVSLALHVGTRNVQAVGRVRLMSAQQAAGMLTLVNRYVANSITAPLVSGKTAPALLPSFSPALATRVAPKSRDRAVLTDEDVPVVTSITKAVKRPVNLVALEQNGVFLMIGASFSLTVTGPTDQGPLTVRRVGNFVLEPDARRHWHITGYSIVVQRNLAGTTTTTRATTTTAAS